MKYIKFLKTLRDMDTGFVRQKDEEERVIEEVKDDNFGLCYCIRIGIQLYYLPDKLKDGQFEIIEKED